MPWSHTKILNKTHYNFFQKTIDKKKTWRYNPTKPSGMIG